MTNHYLDRPTKGPRVRRFSDRTPQAIARVRQLADTNIKAARRAFFEQFGFEVKDRSVDTNF